MTIDENETGDFLQEKVRDSKLIRLTHSSRADSSRASFILIALPRM